MTEGTRINIRAEMEAVRADIEREAELVKRSMGDPAAVASAAEVLSELHVRLRRLEEYLERPGEQELVG